MSATYEGFCDNCGEDSTVTTSAEYAPNTCPFCGGSVEFTEESED